MRRRDRYLADELFAYLNANRAEVLAEVEKVCQALAAAQAENERLRQQLALAACRDRSCRSWGGRGGP